MLMLPTAPQDSPAWDETVSLREIALFPQMFAGCQHFAAGELTASIFTCYREQPSAHVV